MINTDKNVFTTGLVDPLTLSVERRGHTIAYTAPMSGTGVKAGLVIDAKTSPTTSSFEWALLSRLSNISNYGENVAGYFQGYKYNSGPTWAGVLEAQDYSLGNKGALYGLEIDCFASGPGANNRFGIGFNFGTVVGGVKPTIDFGIDFSPNGNNRDSAQLAKGIRFGLDCTFANISIMNSATTPAIIDITQSGAVGSLIKLASSNPVFSNKHVDNYVGKLKIVIDGSTYYIPVYA